MTDKGLCGFESHWPHIQFKTAYDNQCANLNILLGCVFFEAPKVVFLYINSKGDILYYLQGIFF